MKNRKERVVHCKKDVFDVYIGRPSKWGNPYSHKEGTGAEFKVNSREEAVDKYRDYLYSNKELLSSLPELRGKILGCWCSPKPCHGDVLVEALQAINSPEHPDIIFSKKIQGLVRLFERFEGFSKSEIFFASDDDNRYCTDEFLIINLECNVLKLFLFYEIIAIIEGAIDRDQMTSDIDLRLINFGVDRNTIQVSASIGLYEAFSKKVPVVYPRVLNIISLVLLEKLDETDEPALSET